MFTAASRLSESPTSAITAARVMVETTCKTILTEFGKEPTCSIGHNKKMKDNSETFMGIKRLMSLKERRVRIISILVIYPSKVFSLNNS